MCGIEEASELMTEEFLAESILHLCHVANDEGVATLHVVVEEGERRTEGEAVEPETHFCQFDGHGVEVDAVDAAFEHAPFEQVEVGEFAQVYGYALAIHLLLDLMARLGQFMYD